MPDTVTAPPEETTPQADWESSAETNQSPTALQNAEPPAAPALNMGGGSPADVAKAAAAAYTPPPPIVTSNRRGGILGVVDEIADALTGRTRPEIGTDQEGNKYVKTTSLTRGQQWEKIAGEALVGGLKGLAAGRGRGNVGAAGAAGVDEGAKLAQQQQQQEQQMSAEAREQNLEKANHQMLVMKQAEHAFTMTNLQTKATQDDIKFAQEHEDRYKAGGGKLLGVMSSPGGGQLAAILKVNPDVMKEMVQNGTIKTPVHYDANGKPDGIAVWQMPHDFNSDAATDKSFYTFDPVKNELVQHMATDSMTKGQQDAYNMAAFNAKADFNNKKALAAHQQAETDAANARAAVAPSEIAKNNAEAGKASAEAAAARAKTGEATDPKLVEDIGSGKIVPERMSYLLARNPQLLDAVVAKYPDFDGAKAAAYPKIYAEFTDTKSGAGAALNAGATAMEHLKKLQELNTPLSHVYGTPAYNAYHNQLDTLAPELAKFYGDSTVPAIAALKSTLGATLPGNRSSAIATQAASMGQKFDNYEQQWRNAAPSKSYEAPMPNISEKAKDARAALDPEYRQRRVQELQGQQGNSGTITVQIPGSPPGQIPAAALEKFKQDHPNAIITK